MIADDSRPVCFGALKPLPDGYSVWWHPNLEKYMGHGPGDWESPVCWNRFWVRRWCFQRAELRDRELEAWLAERFPTP